MKAFLKDMKNIAWICRPFWKYGKIYIILSVCILGLYSAGIICGISFLNNVIRKIARRYFKTEHPKLHSEQAGAGRPPDSSGGLLELFCYTIFRSGRPPQSRRHARKPRYSLEISIPKYCSDSADRVPSSRISFSAPLTASTRAVSPLGTGIATWLASGARTAILMSASGWAFM